MGKINRCLKYVFVFFNGLFVIAGCVLLIFTVKLTVDAHQYSEFGNPGLFWCYLFSFAVLGTSILGVYGGYTEKRIPLIVFAVFMGIAMVVMLSLGIHAIVVMNKIRDFFERSADDLKGIVDQVFHISLAIYFGVGSIALLSMLISILMVHQIKRHEGIQGAFVPMKSTAGDPSPLVASDY